MTNQTPQEQPPEPNVPSWAARPTSDAQAAATHRADADLKAYLDGELAGPRRWLTARHIATCAPCRREMRRLEMLGHQMRSVDQAVPGPGLRARILASLPAGSPASLAPRLHAVRAQGFVPSSRRPIGALAGACALTLALGGFALTRYGHENGSQNPNPVAASAMTDLAPPDVQPNRAPSGSAMQAAVTGTRPNPLPSPVRFDPFARTTGVSSDGSAQTADQAAAPGRVAQSYPGSAPSPANMRGAYTADANAATPPAYTDPTSREAERLAGVAISDKLRVQHQQAIAQAKAARKPKAGGARPTPPAATQLALNVTNVSEASRQVQQWAAQAGAQVTVLAYKAANPMSGDTPLLHAAPPSHADPNNPEAESASASASGSGVSAGVLPQTPAVLRLKVPVQRADSFKTYLGQVGTPIAPAAPGAAPPRRGFDGLKALEHVHALRTDDMMPHSSLARPAFTPPPSPSGERERTVTIFVRLQSGVPSPR